MVILIQFGLLQGSSWQDTDQLWLDVASSFLRKGLDKFCLF